MGVHVGQGRHEVASGTVHHPDAVGQGDGALWHDPDNDAVVDDDGLAGGHLVGQHRDDVDVHERDVPVDRRRWGRTAGGGRREQRESGTPEAVHRRIST